MPSQLTVTAKTGPAVQNTALVLSNVVRMDFDLANRVVHVYKSDFQIPTDYDLVGVTTCTFSISGSNYTMVIS